MNRVSEPEFWSKRLAAAKRRGEVHRSVYLTTLDGWAEVQSRHRAKLAECIMHTDTVLDAGCGYGSLLEVLPPVASYTGIDTCEELLKEARRLHPGRCFRNADVADTGFPDKYFTVAVARSVRSMVLRELGEDAWKRMEAELNRVAERVVYLEYSE